MGRPAYHRQSLALSSLVYFKSARAALQNLLHPQAQLVDDCLANAASLGYDLPTGNPAPLIQAPSAPFLPKLLFLFIYYMLPIIVD